MALKWLVEMVRLGLLYSTEGNWAVIFVIYIDL
jgi:hypothetical protein